MGWKIVQTSELSTTPPHGVGVLGGADGRRRGFSISQDGLVSMVAIGESLGYLLEQWTLRPPSLFSRRPAPYVP